jgi:protein-tyrosine-phosphatase
MLISIVCHGNIARSQVLHHYLQRELSQRGIPADVFSCGIAPAAAYPNAAELLEEVQRELARRGLAVRVKRACWSPEAAGKIAASDLVLAADEKCRAHVLKNSEAAPARTFLYYEFIGEGPRDFLDTFDPQRGRQDPRRFASCFDELARIAAKAAEKLARSEEPPGAVRT